MKISEEIVDILPHMKPQTVSYCSGRLKKMLPRVRKLEKELEQLRKERGKKKR